MVVGAVAEGGVCLSTVILLVDISGFFSAAIGLGANISAEMWLDFEGERFFSAVILVGVIFVKSFDWMMDERDFWHVMLCVSVIWERGVEAWNAGDLCYGRSLFCVRVNWDWFVSLEREDAAKVRLFVRGWRHLFFDWREDEEKRTSPSCNGRWSE